MAVDILIEAKRPPHDIGDLIDLEKVKTIMRAKRFGDIHQTSSTRTSVQWVLSNIATFLNNPDASKAILGLSRQKRRGKKRKTLPGRSPEISNATLRRLSPFLDDGPRKSFLEQAGAAAILRPDAPLTDKRLYSAQAGLFILSALFGPATPERLASLEFAGAEIDTPYGRRRSLICLVRNEKKAFEENRASGLVARWSLYHAVVTRHFGHDITQAFVKVDGRARSFCSLRTKAAKLLKSFNVRLTLLDLRDLGVAELIAGGADLRRIADRIGYDHNNFLNRYRPLIASLQRRNNR